MPDCNATLRSWAASIAFTSLCLIVLPAPASACTCGSDLYVCSGFDHLRADEAPIFTGTVVGITEVHGEVGRAGQKEVMIVERRVRFVVTEAFFAPLPRELEVSTSLCGYDFEPGQAYLVDANRTSERPTVSICSRTKPLADASDDVELLRGWVRGLAEARIFGAVTLQKPEGGPQALSQASCGCCRGNWPRVGRLPTLEASFAFAGCRWAGLRTGVAE